MRTMSAWGMSAFLAAALGAVAATAMAEEAPALKPGLRVGEYLGPFDVLDVTGPRKGESLCYRCAYGQDPVVCVFARRADGALPALVKAIDSALARQSAMKGFVVVLPGDTARGADALKELARRAEVKAVPLTVFGDGNGPSGYRLAKDAEITVLLWKDYELKASHAFARGGMTEADVAAIVAELPRVARGSR